MKALLFAWVAALACAIWGHEFQRITPNRWMRKRLARAQGLRVARLPYPTPSIPIGPCAGCGRRP